MIIGSLYYIERSRPIHYFGCCNGLTVVYIDLIRRIINIPSSIFKRICWHWRIKFHECNFSQVLGFFFLLLQSHTHNTHIWSFHRLFFTITYIQNFFFFFVQLLCTTWDLAILKCTQRFLFSSAKSKKEGKCILKKESGKKKPTRAKIVLSHISNCQLILYFMSKVEKGRHNKY